MYIYIYIYIYPDREASRKGARARAGRSAAGSICTRLGTETRSKAPDVHRRGTAIFLSF